MNFFISYLWKDPQLFFAVSIIVIFSVCCHEFVHAFTALALGDDTAASRGHLTLNPFKQMGLTSLLLLALFGIAWGKVPVDKTRLRGKHGYALVSAAGPLTNLVLSQVFGILCVIIAIAGIDNRFAIAMLCYGASLNLLLTLLNMMPIPGLDGWSLIADFFPKLATEAGETVKGTYFVLIALFFVFFNKVFSFCSDVIINELEFILSLFR